MTDSYKYQICNDNKMNSVGDLLKLASIAHHVNV
jgi:hypothetical protein